MASEPRTKIADRVGHVIAVIGIPTATVWSLAEGNASQWTWLCLVSVLWHLRNDPRDTDAIKQIALGLAARLSGGRRKE